jgi:integrase/recombinase XerD
VNLPKAFLDLEYFLESLQAEKGLSKNTLVAYQTDILSFLNYIDTKNQTVFSVTQKVVEDYLQSSDNLSARTLHRRLSSLSHFYSFFMREQKILVNPVKLIDRPKLPKTLPKLLSEPDIISLIEVAYQFESPQRLMHIVMVELLYSTGVRVSELVTLRVSDVDWQNECFLIRGKGNKERLVPFNMTTKKALIEYVGPLKNLKTVWLFPSPHKNSPLTRQRVFQILRQLASLAGLDFKKISPHVVRHTFATHLLDHGATLINVQHLLGHSDISTTELYTHVTSKKLKESVFSKHPLSDKS